MKLAEPNEETGKVDTVTFWLERGDQVTVTFNGHISDAPHQEHAGYGPYLWELGPEERAARLAELAGRLRG
jgi:hypothetical protein